MSTRYIYLYLFIYLSRYIYLFLCFSKAYFLPHTVNFFEIVPTFLYIERELYKFVLAFCYSMFMPAEAGKSNLCMSDIIQSFLDQ